uniref:Transmembrane protein 63A n=1 Tax=Neogobius melanostomus TaxID=47308 RepID=A0A8C6TVL8_9GOBI
MSSEWWNKWLVSNGSSNSTFSECFNQSTVLYGNNFGGIPIVLFLDFCVFIFLLILFSIIPKILPFYLNVRFNDFGHRKYGRMSSLISSTDEHDYELGFCSWVPYIIRMDDEKIKTRCGIDAIHYLSFQRNMIFLLIVITITSLGIVLPVNLTGNLLENNPYSFGRTTIANLPQGDQLLWLHTVFAVLYLILTVVFLRRHTSQMKDMRKEIARNALFLSSVPKTATEDAISSHFTEAYPSCRVCDVTLAFDVAKLMHLDKERMRAGKNLRYYEKMLASTGTRQMISPKVCGHFCCCASCEKVDAIEFYSCKEKRLLEDFGKQAEEVPNHPLGIAFVTLQTEGMAKFILKDFNAVDCSQNCCCGKERQPSQYSKSLKVKKWTVGYAPHPKNVFWENLSVRGVLWYTRYLLLNLALFLLLTFLTTPTIIINVIDKFNVTKPIKDLNSPVISQFFPTLLLWTFSALLPTLVYYSTLGEAHWSRSSEQLSMMRKLYFFLLFMVLLLPSLGLTSLAVFFRWIFDTKFLTDGKVKFECVFLPDQGAFFVNYVITAALIGSGMDLLRLPGLLLYAIRMAFARSAAERKYVKQNQAYEFEYGAVYGWNLCVFTVIMAYSIICPMIVPFGLLYMLLKHLVDKHNLYFACLPAASLDKRVHMAAVDHAMAAPIICLIWLYFFSVLRTGFMAATSIFTLVVLCIAVVICLSYTCFGVFKVFSPHNYKVNKDEDAIDGVEENTMVIYCK